MAISSLRIVSSILVPIMSLKKYNQEEVMMMCAAILKATLTERWQRARGYFHGVASTDEMTILVAGVVAQVTTAPLMGAQFALEHSNVVAVGGKA